MALLAKYSPEYPCLLEGIVKQAPRLGNTFRDFIFHINLQLLPRQPRAYTAGDRPVYGATNGPNCANLPNPPIPYYPRGRQLPEHQRRSQRPRQGRQPAHRHRVRRARRRRRGHVAPAGPLGGHTGTAAQKALVNSLVAPSLGVPADQRLRHGLAALRPGHGRHGGERRMSILDKKTRGDFVKLMIFILVTSMATGVLVVLIGNLSFESTRSYKAVFSDATGVTKGDDIRIAGVKVGSVKKVEIVDRTDAEIEFTVAKTATVTRSSTATIRYRNLVGQRYISLTQGVGDLSAPCRRTPRSR